MNLFEKYSKFMQDHFDIVTWFSNLSHKDKVKLYNYHTMKDNDEELSRHFRK